MSAVVDFLMLYCESQHPDSWKEQDKLFESIVSQEVTISSEEMQKAIDDFRASDKIPKEPAITLSRSLCRVCGIRPVTAFNGICNDPKCPSYW